MKSYRHVGWFLSLYGASSALQRLHGFVTEDPAIAG
jgi:hypothetical protein